MNVTEPAKIRICQMRILWAKSVECRCRFVDDYSFSYSLCMLRAL